MICTIWIYINISNHPTGLNKLYIFKKGTLAINHFCIMTCIYDKVIGVKLNSEERKWTDYTYISFKEKGDWIFDHRGSLNADERNSQDRYIPLVINIGFCKKERLTIYLFNGIKTWNAFLSFRIVSALYENR